MYQPIILGIVRHLVGGLGVYFTTKGYIDAESASQLVTNAEVLVGSVATVGSILWSVRDKTKR